MCGPRERPALGRARPRHLLPSTLFIEFDLPQDDLGLVKKVEERRASYPDEVP